MVLEKSRFVVTVDETAELGQWFLESPSFVVTAVGEMAKLGQWYWKGPDLLLQLMKRQSWVSGS